MGRDLEGIRVRSGEGELRCIYAASSSPFETGHPNMLEMHPCDGYFLGECRVLNAEC